MISITYKFDKLKHTIHLNKLANTFLFSLLLAFLSSCYCFNRVTPTVSSVRQLKTSKPLPLCDNWGGAGRSFQLNSYYGFPSTESLKKNLKSQLSLNEANNYRMNSIGQFGVRIEKYIPSLITNYSVFGLGLDYSHGFYEANYTSALTNYTQNVKQYTTMISANHMTLVQGRFVGYLTLQGGIRQFVRKYSSELPAIEQQKIKTPVEFAYRLGYGFQYYPKGPWGVSLEGGYGDAAYIRAGLFWWFL